MKERGLMFTGDMMRAILAGRKTQTRRTVRHSKDMDDCGLFPLEPDPEKCPHGVPGDRIWCRETWADVNTESGPAFTYRADNGLHFCQDDAFPIEYYRYPGMKFTMWCGDLWRGEPGHKWRPSILMPRFAARVILEITDVRVQRLQDITEEDAVAEGAHWRDFGRDSLGYPFRGWSMHDPHPDNRDHCLGKAKWAFGAYVNELADGPRWNLKPSNAWDRNAWVWAITFRRVHS